MQRLPDSKDLALASALACGTGIAVLESSAQLSPDELVRRLRQRQSQAARMLECLTERERQIMEMVTSGLPNKAVARQLEISIKTVEKHRSNVMRKLRINTMCDLLRFWFTLTWDDALAAG